MTVSSYESISTMFSKTKYIICRKENMVANICFFLSTRCLSLERGIISTSVEARLTRSRAGRSPRAARDPLGDSPGRSREAAPSSRRVPAAFEARDPGSASPRLTNPRKPSVPAQVAMPPTVENSTGADAPAAREGYAPKRKREPNARVVRSPRRPARHARPRARAPPAVPPRRSIAPFPRVRSQRGFP